MIIRPKFKMSALRDIGRSQWDPIGVGGPDYGWPADEYDDYLLNAAGQLWHGRSDEEVADYFIKMETENMGLDARLRALDVTSTTRRYVEKLRT